MDLGVLITSDEEIGGKDGTYYAVVDREGPQITADVVIIPDGGDDFRLVTHEKGILQLRLVAEGTPLPFPSLPTTLIPVLLISGVSGHAAKPWEAVNALHLLLNDLQQLREGSQPIKGGGDPKKVFNNEAGGWRTTFSITDLRRRHEKEEEESEVEDSAAGGGGRRGAEKKNSNNFSWNQIPQTKQFIQVP